MLNINITGTFEKADKPINIVKPEAKAIYGCILTESGISMVQVGTSNALENMVTVATLRKIAESIEKKTYISIHAPAWGATARIPRSKFRLQKKCLE